MILVYIYRKCFTGSAKLIQNLVSLSVSLYVQLLGIAIRADIPLALDLLDVFWKCLVGVELDNDRDMEEADVVTHQYIKKINEVGY